MGVLGKMGCGDISTRLEQEPVGSASPTALASAAAVDKQATAAGGPHEPTAPCSKCDGAIWWLDPFGVWRCDRCSLARFTAQVRRRVMVVEGNPQSHLVDLDPNFGAPIDMGPDGVWFELLAQDGGAGRAGRGRQWRREGHLYDRIDAWPDPTPRQEDRKK